MLTHVNSLFIIRSDYFFHRQASDAVDGECGVTAYTNSSMSDEGTPVVTTPPSTDPPIITHGEQNETH